LRLRFFFGLILVIILSDINSASAASRQTIPGTPVSLIPPQDLHLAQDFTGFINDKTKAAILVATFPAGAGNTVEDIYSNRKKFTEIMRKYHFIIENSLNEKTATGEAITIYSGTQSDGATVYDKWATLVSQNGIYMITLQSPKEANLSSDAAIALFRSIKIGAWNSLEMQVSALPFTFTAVPPFTVQATLMGSAVRLQANRQITSDTPRASVYIIRDTQIQSSDNVQLAQKLYIASIRQAFELKKITEEKQISFAGKTGNLLIGTGLNSEGKNEGIILYTTVDDTNKAIYLQATGEKEALFSLKEEIGKIAESIRLKSKN